MKNFCIIALALLAAFELGGPAHAATAQTERVTVKATGSGADRDEALENALKEATVMALGTIFGIQFERLDEDDED